MNTLRDLVDKTTFTGSGSAANGVAVSLSARRNTSRRFLGTVVNVTDDRLGVWVRRITDEADVSVWYSVSELELATKDDLVEAGRFFLGRQYREAIELKAAYAAKEGSKS